MAGTTTSVSFLVICVPFRPQMVSNVFMERIRTQITRKDECLNRWQLESQQEPYRRSIRWCKWSGREQTNLRTYAIGNAEEVLSSEGVAFYLPFVPNLKYSLRRNLYFKRLSICCKRLSICCKNGSPLLEVMLRFF